MIDTKAALKIAREKAHRTAGLSYPTHQMAERRKIFESGVVREFAEMCLLGGYASLIGYAGDTEGKQP